MAKEIVAGSTNQTIDVFIQDSSATDGSGLTGLVYNTAGLTCYYRIGATGTPTALTLADLATIGTAHTDGGFKECEATYMKGEFRLDLSDVMVATAGLLKIYLQGATNMAPCIVELEVVAVNKFDAVRMGMTAIPNAAADAAGGLPISDIGGLDLDTQLANTNEITAARMGALTDWINGGRLDSIIDLILEDSNELQANQGNWLTATGFSTHSAADIWAVGTRSLTSFGTLVSDIWNRLTSALTTTGSIGKLLADYVDVAISSRATASAQANQALDSTVAKESTLSGGISTLQGEHITLENQNTAIYTDTQRVDGLLEYSGGDRYTAKALEAGPGGGTGLTAQQTRDAMKLAPSVGAPGSGSVDEYLTLINAITEKINFNGADDVLATLDSEVVGANLLQLNGTTTVDGSSFSYVFQLMQAMLNGNYAIDTPSVGQITYYKRDGVTVLTIVDVTTTTRTRIS